MMNMTCGGGSSRIFSNALKADVDSVCTSSMMKICKHRPEAVPKHRIRAQHISATGRPKICLISQYQKKTRKGPDVSPQRLLQYFSDNRMRLGLSRSLGSKSAYRLRYRRIGGSTHCSTTPQAIGHALVSGRLSIDPQPPNLSP